MEILEQISNGYKDLFYKTGKIEFFMRAKNVAKLQKNIALVENIQKEDGLTL